jgi:hypothetical protein
MSAVTAESVAEARDYALAGLVVRSDIALPAPAASETHGAVDVTVREGPVGELPASDAGRAGPIVAGDEFDLRLLWPGVAAMRVAFGREVTIERFDAEAEHVAPLVLGVAMGLILHQRGRLVLHASAVALPPGGVAFVGWKGAGKSTMAGALVARGHSIIADDALPLDPDVDGPPMAWPGPAPLKLWPESASALGRHPRRLPRLHPKVSKRVVSDVAQSLAAIPLLAIYSLDVGSDVSIEALRGQAALVELMRHAYAPRFVPAAGATPEHFARCAQVVRSVGIYRLTRPATLEGLPAIAAAVEQHAASLGRPDET